jgi:flagellar biogenesis protein FliO
MSVMNRKFIISLVAFSVSTVTLAGVKVTSLDLKTEGAKGFVSITLEGRSNELPDLKVNGRIIEVTITKADAFNSISKNVSGAHLMANNLNGSAVVKAVLPYEVPADNVSIGWQNSSIEIVFPRGKAVKEDKVAYQGAGLSIKEAAPTTVPVAEKKEQEKKTTGKVSKDILNEDYLNKLMNENKIGRKETDSPIEEVKKDLVNTKQSAVIKKIEADSASVVAEKNVAEASKNSSTSDFSLAGYAAKFTFFLAMVLGLFYGIVQIFKRGIFKKGGKLGFLNNTQMIEVLSTTYIAPKRSLMIVKAHKQIFLVANSENGISVLSEVTDTVGLIKEGEKLVTGSNFDMNLASMANVDEATSTFKIKEDIMQSTPISEDKGLSKIAVAKDIVKFSDELKKKAKKLKPIEFN